MTTPEAVRNDAELLQCLVDVAERKFAGHLTIMKFTTNWRVAFGTTADRHDIGKMPAGRTFTEAAQKVLGTIATQERAQYAPGQIDPPKGRKSCKKDATPYDASLASLPSASLEETAVGA